MVCEFLCAFNKKALYHYIRKLNIPLDHVMVHLSAPFNSIISDYLIVDVKFC